MSRLHYLVIAIFIHVVPAMLYAQAQSGTRIGIGSIVRVTTVKGKALIGAVNETTTDSVMILRRVARQSVESRIARNDIQRVQVHAGKSRIGGALVKGGIGLVAGALIGGILGYVTYDEPPPPENIGEVLFRCLWGCTAGDQAVISAVALGGIGFIGGSIYGASTGIDKWVDVPRR